MARKLYKNPSYNALKLVLRRKKLEAHMYYCRKMNKHLIILNDEVDKKKYNYDMKEIIIKLTDKEYYQCVKKGMYEKSYRR